MKIEVTTGYNAAQRAVVAFTPSHGDSPNIAEYIVGTIPTEVARIINSTAQSRTHTSSVTQLVGIAPTAVFIEEALPDGAPVGLFERRAVAVYGSGKIVAVNETEGTVFSFTGQLTWLVISYSRFGDVFVYQQKGDSELSVADGEAIYIVAFPGSLQLDVRGLPDDRWFACLERAQSYWIEEIPRLLVNDYCGVVYELRRIMCDNKTLARSSYTTRSLHLFFIAMQLLSNNRHVPSDILKWLEGTPLHELLFKIIILAREKTIQADVDEGRAGELDHKSPVHHDCLLEEYSSLAELSSVISDFCYYHTFKQDIWLIDFDNLITTLLQFRQSF